MGGWGAYTDKRWDIVNRESRLNLNFIKSGIALELIKGTGKGTNIYIKGAYRSARTFIQSILYVNIPMLKDIQVTHSITLR